jgi:hypothetical protein
MYLDDLVPWLKPLLGGWAAGLDRRHEDAAVVAAGQPDPDRAVLLEADEPRVRPTQHSVSLMLLDGGIFRRYNSNVGIKIATGFSFSGYFFCHIGKIFLNYLYRCRRVLPFEIVFLEVQAGKTIPRFC